jgi:hypothetical protein
LCSCIGDIGGGTADESCPTDLPRRVVLLSGRHSGNATRDLLALGEAPIPTSAGGNPDALFSGGAERVSSAMAFEYQQIAREAAASATSDVEALVACNGADDAACARSFIERFASRAFRRPLAADDIEGLLRVYEVGREQDGSFGGGIQLVIEAVLQAPSFLYRSELGVPDSDTHHRLTAYELMTELSFFLRDSLPDEALWSAAQDGRLDTPEGLTAEVDRLLADPLVQANVTQILVRWFGARDVTLVEKADPEFTPEVAARMATETELFIHDVLWNQRGGTSELFTSPRSWIDERLAAFYGIPYPGGGGFVAVDLPAAERAGILTHGSLLAARADVDETSVVRRGLFVYRDLLCQSVSPPPSNAAEIASEVAETHPTERARAEFRMAHAVCGGCHGEFDSFGLAFEGYDAVGRYRAGPDASWTTVAPAGAAGSGSGGPALAAQLVAAPELLACGVRQLASYGVGRPLTRDEACHLGEIEDTFASSGKSLVELVRAVAVSRLLRLRQDGGAP